MRDQYCIYLRKSRADFEAEAHGEGETLARHETTLLAVAKKMKLPIGKIYREIVSGESIEARPEVQQLLIDVENGMWAGVLVMEVERLARGDTMDQGRISRTFSISETLIITPERTYDTAIDSDEEYLEFGLFMSRREYKTINRRMQYGRIASVKEGKCINSVAPYGYKREKIKNDKGYTLIPIQPESDIVRLIFDLYVNGELQNDGTYKRLGMFTIAQRLDSMNCKTRRGGQWSRATIRDIISNPKYIGDMRHQYTKEYKTIVDGKIVKKSKINKNPLICKGIHEPLIDKETFVKAQAIKASRQKETTHTNSELMNPLSGIVYCKKCGNLMTRMKDIRRTYSFLTCPNSYCDNVSASLPLVEEHVIESLKNWLPAFKLKYSSNDATISVNELNVLKVAISNTENEIKTLEKQLNNTYDLLERGIYTPEIFTTRNKTLADNISIAKSKLVGYRKEYNKLNLREKAKSTFIPKVESLISGYYMVDSILERNRLLKEVLEKVVYLKTEKNTRGKSNNANFTLELYPRIPTE